MCGILGLLGKKIESFDLMLDQIQHRGPDSFGVWNDESITLGHRRLSIVDLSPAGHQPMVSASERYVITYNGEIYNFPALRQTLEQKNYSFKGHSDTEILLACVEEYGVEETLKKINGMFAFGLWDRQEKLLYLARDRFGEKPLYYGWIQNNFVFSSELKPFKKHPQWQSKIDAEALALYLQYSYIPAPYSIYENIKKLEPGKFLILNAENNSLKIKEYWSAINVAVSECNKKMELTDEETIDLLDEKLSRIVHARQMADVPLGAFLSGGVDSSTVVALMQKNSVLPIKTFTIGFEEEKYNEAIYAKEVARHLKTEHTEVYLKEKDALNVIPKLPFMYDEPFADSSQIPTFLVNQIARQHVTVCLSGDAGDELFGGYNRYLFAKKLSNKLNYTPFFLRKMIALCVLKMSPDTWDKVYNAFIAKVTKLKISGFGDKIHKIGRLLNNVHNKYELYNYLISQLQTSNSILLSDTKIQQDFSVIPHNLDYIDWMMLADVISYLPGDILTKVDRASMAVSLESRVPFLDPELYEFVWKLPQHMKIRNGQSKWLLRQVLYRYVPQELIERPKMGFGVPIDSWLRGELKDWAEALLDKKIMQEQGYFNVESVHNLWQQHLSGKRNFSHQLWNILMFQAWLRSN